LQESHFESTQCGKLLSVPSPHLRRLVWSNAALADAVFDQIEKALDEAEAVLWEG